MNELTVSVRSEAVLARMLGAQDRLQENLRRAVVRLSFKAQNAVKFGKLTGQVLHVRTQNLRGSINRRITESDSGVVASVGTNVKYAAIHEYGYQGTQNIRAHVRKMRTGSVANVRAHVRRVNLPARSFLRSTLQEMKPEIQVSLRRAVLSALQPAGGSA